MTATPHLFDRWSLRSLSLSNRIVVSPMCQYSSTNGLASDWHLVHLGARAVGGAALVFTEATAVTPEGRISPVDLGVWSDAHVDGLARIARFVHAQGSAAGVQIAHAGRKGSTAPPWEGGHAVPPERGGWVPVGPGPEPYAPAGPPPRALTVPELQLIVAAFAAAARRVLDAGFDVLEIHAAHGYLLHEFLSPIVNTRTDAYGGSFENRARLCLDVVRVVREVWPDRRPVFVRISATDWVPGGWDLDEAVELCRRLKDAGVDLIDCSSGGAVPHAQVRTTPGTRCRSPNGSGARRRLRPGPWDSSRRPTRPRRSWRKAAPTASCWRANCCAVPTGPSRLPGRSTRGAPGRASICGRRRRASAFELLIDFGETRRADAMAEPGLGVLRDVGVELLPVVVVGANALAVPADREQAL